MSCNFVFLQACSFPSTAAQEVAGLGVLPQIPSAWKENIEMVCLALLLSQRSMECVCMIEVMELDVLDTCVHPLGPSQLRVPASSFGSTLMKLEMKPC